MPLFRASLDLYCAHMTAFSEVRITTISMPDDFLIFEELIRQQDEANRKDGYDNPRELRTSWESRAAELLGSIQGWLMGSSIERLIHLEAFNEPVFDPDIGRFIAPGLIVTIPSGKWITIKVTGFCKAQIAPPDVGVPVELAYRGDADGWWLVGDEERPLDRSALGAVLCMLAN